MKLSSHGLTPHARVSGFVVWFGSVSGKPPRRSSALPPRRPTCRLHLNAFRGEPAISEFVWHFTSIPSSSEPFATGSGPALHERVPPASAWPGIAHSVSGHPRTTLEAGLYPASPPFRTRVRSGSTCLRLSLATLEYSSAHSTKGTPSP